MKINQKLYTIKNYIHSFITLSLLLSLLGITTQHVHAEVIDRIEINQVGDEAEIQLHFITRIQYKRQAVLKSGDIRIYVTLLDIESDDPRLVWEKKGSPSSDIVLPFTITYPELDSSLTLSFGKVVKSRVRAGSDGYSLSIFTKAIKPKKQEQIKLPVVVPPVALPSLSVAATAITKTEAVVSKPLPKDASPVVEPTGFATDVPVDAAQKTPEQIEQEAQQLYVLASDALQANQIGTSIDALNKVLNLPPNILTQAAQELMGEAREKNGEFVKARAEYELYLKLYPKALDAKQVQTKIANLPKEDTKPVQAPPSQVAQEEDEGKIKITGGISQIYYKGLSNTNTFDTSGATPTTTVQAREDLSLLTSALDMTAWKRSEKYDTRVVLRESNKINFLPNKPEDYRWNVAYLEQRARNRKFMYRLGRQSSAPKVWIPGRFDGLTGGYSFNSTWRVNAALGKPVEFGTSGDEKTFYSGSVELNILQWSGSVYSGMEYIGGYRGKVGGVKSRRVLGADVFYSDTQRNYLTQLEFDTIYHKINFATFQGNWTHEPSATSYFMRADHRRSPSVALSLTGQFSQSLKEVLGSGRISLQALRDNAVSLSPISNTLSFGLSRIYSPRLTLSSDFTITNTAGTGAYIDTLTSPTLPTTQPAAVGTNNQYSYSVTATGNNLIFENDAGTAAAIFTSSDTNKSQTLVFSQTSVLKQKWRVGAGLALVNQSSSAGRHETQIKPSAKADYTMSDTTSFSTEIGLEFNHPTTATSDEKIFNKYFSLGYRWDFR